MQCNHEVYVRFSRTVTGRWIVPTVRSVEVTRGEAHLGKPGGLFQKHFVLAGLTKRESPVFHTSPSTKKVLSGLEALSSTEPLGAVLSFSSPWQGARPCRLYAHWMYCCPRGMWCHTSAPGLIAAVRELTSRELPGKPQWRGFKIALKDSWGMSALLGIWQHSWPGDGIILIWASQYRCEERLGRGNWCLRKLWYPWLLETKGRPILWLRQWA